MIPQTPRELINWWLDAIGENDQACRNEVIDACANNPEAKKFYIKYAKEYYLEHEKGVEILF